MNISAVRLNNIGKSYGNVRVLSNINLSINRGEFVVFVGPSGCGKSTLLRMIAGLEEITDGELQIDGVRMNDTHPAKREVAMVFQSYALYPHMTVAENIGFSMRLAKAPKAETIQKVEQTAKILQITPLLQRKPAELSGGQRQRVAIGRAIIRAPKVFLFDEPLSNLDASLRVHMRLELERLHKEIGATMIYVTHDQVEAMTLADKIVVLNGGDIQQTGSPIELYNRPKNRFVANFIGSPSMNFIPVNISSAGEVNSEGRQLTTLPLIKNAVAGACTLGVRPEHLNIDGNGKSLVEGRLKQMEHLGAETLLYVATEEGALLTVRISGMSEIRIGDQLKLYANHEYLYLFENDNGPSQGRVILDYAADSKIQSGMNSRTQNINKV